MELRTFNEWSQMGYKINKGAKSYGKTSAGYMFSREQVTYSPSRGIRPFYGYNYRGDLDMMDGRDDPWADEAYESTWGGD